MTHQQARPRRPRADRALLDRSSVLKIATAPITWPIGMGAAARHLPPERGIYCYSAGGAGRVGEPHVEGLHSAAGREFLGATPPPSMRKLRWCAVPPGLRGGATWPVASPGAFGRRSIISASRSCWRRLPAMRRPRAAARLNGEWPAEEGASSLVSRSGEHGSGAPRPHRSCACAPANTPAHAAFHARFGKEVRGRRTTFMASDRAQAEGASPATSSACTTHAPSTSATPSLRERLTTGAQLAPEPGARC